MIEVVDHCDCEFCEIYELIVECEVCHYRRYETQFDGLLPKKLVGWEIDEYGLCSTCYKNFKCARCNKVSYNNEDGWLVMTNASLTGDIRFCPKHRGEYEQFRI